MYMTEKEIIQHNQATYTREFRKMDRWGRPPRHYGVTYKLLQEPANQEGMIGLIGYQIGGRPDSMMLYFPLHPQYGKIGITTLADCELIHREQ